MAEVIVYNGLKVVFFFWIITAETKVEESFTMR